MIGLQGLRHHGCFTSDSAAAVQQAILDGVDVINFSISGGTEPFTDPVELAFLDAYAAGVFVAASAGNDGPGAGTANHLAPWVTTVGASTQTADSPHDAHPHRRRTATRPRITGASIRRHRRAGCPSCCLVGGAYNDALCQTPPRPARSPA